MARRKKSHHKKYRRHRIGATGSMGAIVTKVAGIAGGAVLANLVKKQFTTLSPTISNSILLGAGIFVPRFARNSKLIEGVGDGLTAVGAIGLLQSFNVISGIGAILNPSPQFQYRTPYGGDMRVVGSPMSPTPGILDQTVGAAGLRDIATVGALYDN